MYAMRAERKRAPSSSPLGSLQDAANLRELVQRLQEGIYVTNAAGDFLDANPALLQVLGIATLEELRGHKVTDFIDSELRTWKVKRMERDGFVRDLELQIRRADGSTRTVLDTAFMQSDVRSGKVFCCGILVDITERKLLETQLKEQAVRDPLTGCLNRRYLSMLEITGEGMPGSWGCLVIDVDHFKDYNDRYGHQTGDEVLRRVAQVFAEAVRELDLPGRFGGEEIALVLPGTNLTGARHLAERIRKGIEDLHVPTPEGDPLRVTASFGAACFPTHSSAGELVAAADASLYDAKREGKNRVATATAKKKSRTAGVDAPFPA